MSDPGDDHATILRALTQEIAAVARLSGGLRRVSMQVAGHSVEVEWSDAGAHAGAAASGTAPQDPLSEAERAERDDLFIVRAPLVGTFYTAPQPGAPPFVSVGDTVAKGQTLAIVEAMKLMNPLLAECGGTVEEVLVGNGEPVEFDQPLIVLAKAEYDDGRVPASGDGGR